MYLKGVVAAICLVYSASITIPERDYVDIDIAEQNCLAKNIYHEARGEPIIGQYAVARVTLNRLKYSEYPSTICGIVYQHNQFSWTNKPNKINNYHSWKLANAIAYNSIVYNLHNELNATHYHSVKVNPKWKYEKVAYIGNHIFYKQYE